MSPLDVNASFFFLIFSAVIETSCHLLMGKLSKELAKTCGEIMNGSGANRKAVMGKEFNARVHGLDYDPGSLPQEEPYKTERDFYNRELNVDYDLFKAAVNESA